MNWMDYREKLNIGFSDETKLIACKNRLRNILPELEPFYSHQYLYAYANMVGEDFRRYYIDGSDYLQCAYESVCCTGTLKEFISKYIAMANTAIPDNEDYDKSCGALIIVALQGTFEHLRIAYELIKDKDGFFVFPKGVDEFDNALVSDVLIWLSQYPKAEKAWKKALKAYSESEDPSQTADLFRKALETFFQSFFDNGKTLENAKSIYGEYLKSHGIPSEIAGNFETLLQQYTNFMNGYAKHHDRTSNDVLEYLMYQTGNIIRLMITLQQKEQQNPKE